MQKAIQTIYPPEYPLLLNRLDKVPEKLDIIGTLPSDDHKWLCIVGSRTHSEYGVEVCKEIIRGLAGYPIVIVSGLAIGIDSLAHEIALEVGLKIVVIPGSGLDDDTIYPQSHLELAKRIIDSGGTLISPYEPTQKATRWTFPVRNQLMAGLSHAVLVIEARKKSGTMITANAAGDINRDTLAVPGSIFSDLSSGPHELLRKGATAVTCAEDVLEALGFDLPVLDDENQGKKVKQSREAARQKWLTNASLSPLERRAIGCLGTPRVRDDLMRKLNICAADLSAVLVELELRGVIGEQDGYIVWISTR